MKKVRLNDLFHFREGSHLKAGEGKEEGEYPFFTSSSIQGKYIDTFQFQGEHLIFGTGGKPSIHYIKSSFSVSTDCLVLQPIDKNHLFNAKYIYYYIMGNMNILEAGFRGAGLKHISKSYISNLGIPLPSFGEQNKIVKVLDKAQKIRKHSIVLSKQLFALEQSIYFSLFGINAKGYKKWQPVKLDTLTNKSKGGMRTGPFGSDLLHSEFSKSGDVKVLGIDNAVENYFTWGENRFITTEKYKKLKRYTVYPRDVVITIMATIGRSCVIPTEIPLAINTKHLAAITIDETLANPFFISFTLHSNPEIINQIKSKSRGAIMGGINLTVIKNLVLKLPPISLQNKFEKILDKIAATKTIVERKLNESNDLFDVLSQRAFTGKLKMNSLAFSIDDQVVDYIEAKSEQRDILNNINNTFPEISELILTEFRDKDFTFLELDKKISEYGIQNTYEFVRSENKIGLKDVVFALLDPKEDGKSFLTQVFEIDKNRDAEKNIDDSHISFKLTL